ncbi:hypothetical protein FHS56_002232 [Thermonema lapsum]|uniref:Uncharacterized protein n=1 Tax=Thermonema lapsum TaxID=28195 RepID=A0A846MTS4_9BACT|nr:hypothetical protein [Thermonema lapsum]
MKPFHFSAQRTIGTVSSCFVLIAWLLGNVHGVAYTNDSLHFAASGHSFWHNGTWIDANGARLTHWQPLYPTVLGLFLKHDSGVFVLHLLCLICFIYGTWRLIRLWQLSAWCYVAIVCHPMVLTAFSFVWTEALALPLFVWFLWGYERLRLYTGAQRLPVFLLLVALIWCRFSFLPPIYALLLWDIYHFQQTKQLRLAWLLLAVSLLAVFAWVAYAYLLQGGMLENYGMWQANWLNTLILYMQAWGNYFLPSATVVLLPVAAIISIIAFVQRLIKLPDAFFPRRLAAAAGACFLFLLMVNIQSYDDQLRYLLPVWLCFVPAVGNLCPTASRSKVWHVVLITWLLGTAARSLHAAFFWQHIRQSASIIEQPLIRNHTKELLSKASVHKR